jgi:hypothetical protein
MEKKMQKYTTLETVAIGSGSIVELNAQQAESRKHNLKELGDGRFEVVNNIQFKKGETFGFEGTPPKTLQKAMVDSEKHEQESAAQADAGRGAETKPTGRRGFGRRG